MILVFLHQYLLTVRWRSQTQRDERASQSLSWQHQHQQALQEGTQASQRHQRAPEELIMCKDATRWVRDALARKNVICVTNL